MSVLWSNEYGTKVKPSMAADTPGHIVHNTISQHHLHHSQQTLYVQETSGNGAHDEGLQTTTANSEKIEYFVLSSGNYARTKFPLDWVPRGPLAYRRGREIKITFFRF